MLCREQVDFIEHQMGPAIGDARSLEKEVVALRAQLTEVKFNRDFLKSECRDKDREIEQLKRKVFRLESLASGSSSVPTSDGAHPTVILSTAATTAVPMEEEKVQGAEGGASVLPDTPAVPMRSEEQIQAMSILQDLLANAGADQLRTILGGVCQSLAPIVVKPPGPLP